MSKPAEDYPQQALDPQHAHLLLESFKRATGRDLFEVYANCNADTCEEEADDDKTSNMATITELRLFEAPFCVLSHGTQADPVLNYGNAQTLALWEMTWEQLIVTPSRLTAEPLERAARQKLLDQVREVGYVGDYAGVRISRSGRRFRIVQAYVWDIRDADGILHGQAAAFANWEEVAQRDGG